MSLPAEQSVAHLQPAIWAWANRQLLAKAIGEFAHELLIRPQQGTEGDWNVYRLPADNAMAEYRFRARRRLLDHWVVDPGSIVKRQLGEPAEPDAQQFILEFRRSLGIDPELLPTYLEEISSTLYSSAFKHAGPAPSAEALTRADFQTVETAMVEGIRPSSPTAVASASMPPIIAPMRPRPAPTFTSSGWPRIAAGRSSSPPTDRNRRRFWNTNWMPQPWKVFMCSCASAAWNRRLTS